MNSVIFKNTGSDFSAIYAAEKYLEEKGYTVGSMCGDEPIGFAKNYLRIAKWKNLSTEDKKSLEGVIESKDYRNGEVTATFKE